MGAIQEIPNDIQAGHADVFIEIDSMWAVRNHRSARQSWDMVFHILLKNPGQQAVIMRCQQRRQTGHPLVDLNPSPCCMLDAMRY